AWRRPDRQRYLFQCAVRWSAKNHRATAPFEPHSHVRREQRRWRYGQDDRCAIDLHRYRGDQSGWQRRRHLPLRFLALRGACSHRRSHREDRKSTRLNSSHLVISYAVFCLKKKKKNIKHYIFFYILK